jgi:hypothetical protein
MSLSKYCFLFFFFLQITNIFSQKLLQMDIDKFGARISYEIGDELEFQVDGKKDWYKFTINGFDYEKQEIIFDELSVPLSRISKIIYIKKGVRRTCLWLGSLFTGFGIPWTVYSFYGLIVKSPMVGPATFLVGASAIVAAAILLTVKLFWKRKYCITEKRRLRIIDLTIYPNKALNIKPLKDDMLFAIKTKHPSKIYPKGDVVARERLELSTSAL